MKKQEANFCSVTKESSSIRKQGHSAKNQLTCKLSPSPARHKMRNLLHQAMLFEKQGQIAQSQALYEEALAICEVTYGINHHRTAMVTLKLARAYRLQGNVEECALLADHARQIFRRNRASAPGGSDGFWALMGEQTYVPDSGWRTPAAIGG